MIRKIQQTKAQATTELALFGTIMLVILSVLLRYVMIFNAQQEVEMFAFRQALKESQLRNNDNWFMGDPRFAAANINVQKTIYPPDVFGAQGPQDATTVSASASVVVEAEAALYQTDEMWELLLPMFTEWVRPANKRYILGPNNEILNPLFNNEPGYMIALRWPSEEMPLNAWEGIKDTLNGRLNPTNWVVTWEPVPYRDQEQNTTIEHSGSWQTVEHSEGSAGYVEDSQTTIATTTRYLAPDVDQLRDEDLHLLWALPITGDMVLDDVQTFTISRTGTTPQ